MGSGNIRFHETATKIPSEDRGKIGLVKQRDRKRQRIQYNRAFRYKNRNLCKNGEEADNETYPITNKQIAWDW